MRVLIIEDERLMVQYLLIMLRGYCIIRQSLIATDYKSAINLLNKNLDLIISDYTLGDHIGLDVLEAVKHQYDIPFIMILSEGNKEWVMNCHRANVNDILIKPFSPQQLYNKLDKIGVV